MTVDDNHIITLSYELRENDEQGPLMEVMDIAYPFVFFFKTNMLLDAFQEKLRGTPSGSAFSFVVPCEDAYGPRNPDEIKQIPIERFVIEEEGADTIRDVGEFVTLTDSDGMNVNGRVVEKTPTHLKVDLNHAMAGKNLHFSGRILSIRPANIDEIAQKRFIPPDGVRF